ncbi:MAG TPA: D-2-hydroxyacid dehydrogenase [Woeseiaceae bacterium]|nr:D-2-hydroxyacid dehydrogenase [Woeseiaceae bacterium]
MKKRPLALVQLLLLTSLASAQGDWTVAEFIAETGVREGPVPSRKLPGWTPNPTILLSGGLDAAGDLAHDFPDANFVVTGAKDANVIIGSCPADQIREAQNLVWVQIFSAGAERCLAVDELGTGKVLLTNGQKMSSPAIGEHAVAMGLSLARGLVRYSKVMRDGQWRSDITQEPGIYSVSGKTMLVVGLGGIGTAAAKRASALGMRVIATRNSSREGPPYVAYVGLSEELPQLAGEADIIVNALPLTSSTRGLFDKALFGAVKPGAYFVNVGRGGTVVTADLVAALESGQLAGAGLDVTDPEPLTADHPLWQMPNVIITPHVSWAGSDRRYHNTLLRENIRRYLAGEALLNVVDPERGY